MNNTTKIVLAVVAVALIAGGTVLLAQNNANNKSGNDGTTNTPSTGNNPGNNPGDNPGNNGSSNNGNNNKVTVSITYTNSGFSQSSITVPSGSVLRITNQSDRAIKPSSDPHPAHTDNPELNFPDIKPGQSATMTLTAKGTWGMHDHFNDDHRATIVVQ